MALAPTPTDFSNDYYFNKITSLLSFHQFYLIVCCFLFIQLPALSQKSTDNVEIVPMFECVRWIPEDNEYEATFGYNNPSKKTITVPPENSALSCDNVVVEGSEVNVFKPGRVFAAFTARFSCAALTWTVIGPSGKPLTATATPTSSMCASKGNITPNLSSPFKTANKIGSELTILPTSGAISSDIVYQIKIMDGVQYVFVSFYAVEGKLAALLTDLSGLGLRNAETAGLHITGWLPVSNLMAANGLVNLDLAMPVYTPLLNGGAVSSQGDTAQRTDLTRLGFHVQGEGVKVGVLSDSYNARLGNEALLDVNQADLPGPGNPLNSRPVQVLKDLPQGSGLGTDEGRAMLQIIHDIAPKAELAFRSGFDGPIDLANGIRELQAAGCNIIVDDITFITDQFFTDGIVAQAVDEVVSRGVTYFSAAGNFGEKSHMGTFSPTSISGGRTVHNFSGGDYQQRIHLPAGSYTIAMQWVSNSGQDLDIYLTDDSGNIIIGYNRFSTFPYEAMAFHVSEGGAVANIMIENASKTIDPSTIFKYIIFRGNAFIGEYSSGVSTIAGHANAKGAIAVGAVLYTNTLRYGNVPSIASFSSRGGTPIYRDASNNPTNEIRIKPDFAAPNGVNTSVPLGGVNIDGDVFPNFFGTSAAAPHAAAAAALLIEAHKKYTGQTLTPASVRNLLTRTALDMGTPGYDKATGAGFIRPDAAISTFATPTPLVSGFTTPEGTATGKPIIIKGYYFQNISGKETKITFDGVAVPTTYISETQLQALIPTYTGNPEIRVCNPSTSIMGGDGGCSPPLRLFPKTIITIKADNKTKRYGDTMPTFTATITSAPVGISQDVLKPSDIQFTTLATDTSDVRNYTVTPSIPTGHPILAQTALYDFVYEPGTLTIEKIDLVIEANDLALADGEPIKGFNYTYNFPIPINNTPERIELIKNDLKQTHASLQSSTVLVVSETSSLNIEAIRNKSFLISATAETNGSRVINGSRVMNVTSTLLNELMQSEYELNGTRVINATFLMNASRVINGSRVMNGSRVINTSTIGEANNEKAIVVLDALDEQSGLNRVYAANLITGYTLGEHLWSPASLLSNNVNVTYGNPAYFFVNPIGTGVRAVKPVLDCVQESGNGTYIAHFSYDNPNKDYVRLPEGSENKLVYTSASAPQFVNGTRLPRIFKPGKHYAFSVEFNGTKLYWDITSYQGTKKTSIASEASSSSARCRGDYAPLTTSVTAPISVSDNEIAFYPNPVSDKLMLDIRGLQIKEATVTIYDLLGRVCMQNFKLKTDAINEINMADLEAGLYLIKIDYADESKQIRIVKQ